MRVLNTTAVVHPDHRRTVLVPADVPPGPCEVVVVLDKTSAPPKGPVDFSTWPAHNVGLWPEDLSLRREDLYGDDGR
jgi:hypothetical protein